MQFSKRASKTPASPIRKLVPLAEEAKKKGVKVYHLNIGDPDIKTPKVIFQGLKKFPGKIIRYANSQGEKVFLEALLSYYHKLGFTDLTSDNLIVTQGGSEAILWTMLAVCDPGEEIIVFEPFYANYAGFASMAGVRLVPITTTVTNGFHLPERKEIKKKISPQTRAILICNPNNPTGTVFSQEELKALYDLCQKYHLFLLSDEVYREFCYDDKRPYSLLNFKGDNLGVLDSLSKRYSLCGARLGCLVTRNKELIQLVLKFGQARLSAGFLDQIMAANLTNLPKNYFDEIRKEYQARRNVVFDSLKEIPGVICQKPEGAFYLIAGLPIDDAEKFSKWLLTNFEDRGETIMLAPAAGFYMTSGLGKNEVRIAYVINQSDLKRSMEILSHALVIYQRVNMLT